MQFKGGQLAYFHKEWERLTTACNILQTVSGDCIEFISNPPTQMSYPPNSISKDHKILAKAEIENLLEKGVIVSCDHEPGNSFHLYLLSPKRMEELD